MGTNIWVQKKDPNIWVNIYGSKETGPIRRVQRDRSKQTGQNRLVQEDRMVQIYPNWSNMVQNQTEKCPNGSGITRSPGLVIMALVNRQTMVPPVRKDKNKHIYDGLPKTNMSAMVYMHCGVVTISRNCGVAMCLCCIGHCVRTYGNVMRRAANSWISCEISTLMVFFL